MKTLLRFALPILLLATVVTAAPLYDRSLDPTHMITWTPTGVYILGDDFGFGGFSQAGTIGKVTVWMVGENTGTTNPNQEAASIALYLGIDPGPLTKVSSNYTFANAGTYANPALNRNQPIFALTFDNLLYNYPANKPIDFAVEGITTGTPFNLAAVTTGGACPGGPLNNDPAPTSCDNVFVAFNGTVPGGPYNVYFSEAGGDINVLVESAIPEPSTFALLGLGAGALALIRRRRSA